MEKSNNGIKQDFEGTDYEVDTVIKIPSLFFLASDIFMCVHLETEKKHEIPVNCNR